MKKRNFWILSSVAIALSVLGTLLAKNHLMITRSIDTPYHIYLNNNQKITTSDTVSDGEVANTVLTAENHPITLVGSNIINHQDGWQTLLPNGYVYNPFTNAEYHNKITGLKAMRFTSDNSCDLSIHYGYAPNEQQVVYSFEDTITANTEYIFENSPSYFYLKNNNTFAVNINELTISFSCHEEEYPNNNLKVLMIGNSFSDDTVFYSERVANGFGINIELYDAYIAGCTIEQHYTNLNNDSASYSMRSMNGSSWSYQNDKTLRSIIEYRDWDIITFQQASGSIGRPDSYQNLTNLVNQVRNIVEDKPRFYWYQTWAYDADYSDYYDYFSYFNNDQMAMFNAIIDCYNNRVAPLGLFEKSIFAGTAVQNMRTSYMGDGFTRDGKHMSSVHGRYLLANNFISNLLEIDLDITKNTYLPNDVNATFLPLVKESVRNARSHPLTITNSEYTTWELEDYDLSDYTEIDAELVGCTFYNSTDSSNYNKRIGNTAGTSNKYVTTKRFTKDTLPIGSIVFCKELFGYRPEAWTGDYQQSSRPSEQYDNVLEITEQFWQGYQYRAFNIFKCGKIPLSEQYVNEQYDEVFDGFHIYVPNDKLGSIPIKDRNDSYYSDLSLFNNYGLDINNYHRLHLDPIMGFYKCDEIYSFFNKYADDEWHTALKFVCTKPFFRVNNDLPEGTVLIIDSGYQYRSDCWKEKGTYSPRPNNVTTNFTILDSSFLGDFRVRTFNVSATSGTYVYQNAIAFMNHFRIYLPN